MAKIQEENYVIRLSTLVSNRSDVLAPISDKDFITNLEAILQEMVASNIIVEIEQVIV